MRRDLATEIGEVQNAEELCQQKLRLFALIGDLKNKEALDAAELALTNAKESKKASADELASARSITIRDAGFSHQLAGIIRGKGFVTLGDLADKTEEELAEAGFKKGLPMIEAKLRELGLR